VNPEKTRYGLIFVLKKNGGKDTANFEIIKNKRRGEVV